MHIAWQVNQGWIHQCPSLADEGAHSCVSAPRQGSQSQVTECYISALPAHVSLSRWGADQPGRRLQAQLCPGRGELALPPGHPAGPPTLRAVGVLYWHLLGHWGAPGLTVRCGSCVLSESLSGRSAASWPHRAWQVLLLLHIWPLLSGGGRGASEQVPASSNEQVGAMLAASCGTLASPTASACSPPLWGQRARAGERPVS